MFLRADSPAPLRREHRRDRRAVHQPRLRRGHRQVLRPGSVLRPGHGPDDGPRPAGSGAEPLPVLRGRPGQLYRSDGRTFGESVRRCGRDYPRRGIYRITVYRGAEEEQRES